MKPTLPTGSQPMPSTLDIAPLSTKSAAETVALPIGGETHHPIPERQTSTSSPAVRPVTQAIQQILLGEQRRVESVRLEQQRLEQARARFAAD